MTELRRISVAITTYNRFELTVKSIEQILEDKRVKRIYISDDCSTDGSYQKLVSHYAPYTAIGRVTVCQNIKNLDCYRNKLRSVEMVVKDWHNEFNGIILLDSDNVIDSTYIDALFAIPEWDKQTIYMPEFARPCFDYREFSGVTVDKSNISLFIERQSFDCCLNTCNYFVDVEEYKKIRYRNDIGVDPVTSDTEYFALCWLKSGGKLNVTTGLQYDHRMHDGGHYVQNVHRSGDIHNRIINELKSLR